MRIHDIDYSCYYNVIYHLSLKNCISTTYEAIGHSALPCFGGYATPAFCSAPDHCGRRVFSAQGRPGKERVWAETWLRLYYPIHPPLCRRKSLSSLHIS